jgi:hypothetical protein
MKNLQKFILSQILVVMALVVLIPANTLATVYTLDLAMTGQSEVPPNGSPATGILIGTYNDATNLLSFNLMFSGLVAPAVAAHIHGPATPGVNGPVIIPLAGFPLGVTMGTYSNTFSLTLEQEANLLCGLLYVNIHTAAFPGGEIRSQLTEGMVSGSVRTLALALTGQKEVPPNPSPATGTLIGTYNTTTHILNFSLMFNGLVGPTTASHFHSPAPPGVNGPVQIPLVGFPVGVTSGIYSNSFVLTPPQEADLLAGLMYINVHSAVFPGGEIRSQVTEGALTGECTTATIPVSDWALLLGGLLIGTYGFFMVRRRI